MKVYFSASISQDEYRKNYTAIVKALEELGHNVIAGHILDKTSQEYESQSEEESLAIQRKMAAWKKQANMSVFEVTSPSLGVGQEINFAINNNKPVLALYVKGNKPHILQDEGENLLFLVEYELGNLKEILKEYIEYAKEQQDVRFNFFVSPKIQQYLDWIAKHKRVPRAVYLRNILEADMKANKEWKAQK